jgi:RNA polymerase sigma-70 factor (ECF subfamily)
MPMSIAMVLEPDERAVDHGPRADRDLALLEALKRQESTAAERLITAYGERAFRLAARITGSEEDAEEVVQDAFLTVVRKIDSFRGESAFATWLYRIVANAAYQKLRGRQGRRRELSLDEVLPFFDGAGHHSGPLVDWAPRVDDPSVQTELRTALMSAIEDLPAAHRTVLLLRDVDGWSVFEIAETLGLSVCNVKSRAHRARLFLRKQLGEFMTLQPMRAGASRLVRNRLLPDPMSTTVPCTAGANATTRIHPHDRLTDHGRGRRPDAGPC